MTINARNISGQLIVSILLSLVFCRAWAEGGDVPIDSPRGGYAGAENIHWYMQTTLDYNILAEDPPDVSKLTQCNSNDDTRSCSGELFNFAGDSLPLLTANHVTQVLAYVLVDSRIDFSFRYAIKQIRDVNRMLENSGIKVRILISEIKGVTPAAVDDVSFFDYYLELEEQKRELTATNGADIILAFLDPDSFSIPQPIGGETYVVDGVDVQLESIATQFNFDGYDIQVVVQSSRFPIALAHGVGHTLGLAHNASGDELWDFPFLASGVGFIDEESECGTIMNPFFCTVPLFSSPYLVADVGDGFPRVKLGSATQNAVAAANEARFVLGLANEVVHQGYDPEQLDPDPLQ